MIYWFNKSNLFFALSQTEVILKLVEIEKVAPLWDNPQRRKTIKKGATNEIKH